MNKLPYRQIHLDFHTSEFVDNVGDKFDANKFADTLNKARVNSITCFAKCHHGWIYYDSKKFPERVHPKLRNKNLLHEQIEACHKKNIRVPIYITVGWDNYTANEHPEWLVVNEEGAPTYGVYKPGFYRWLCLNSPYRELLKKQTIEVLEEFKEVDGLFFDMIADLDCSCKHCREKMQKLGFNPLNKQDRIKFYKQTTDEFKREMTDLIRQYNSECSIFYNSDRSKDIMDAYTHFEIEALPGDKWGYMDFVVAALYGRNLGYDYLGMTGKFHTSWGDFHSFKNKEALEYECFRMLALNGKCLIGDQLEPNGQLSEPVYDLIGSVYSQIEKKEPWCVDAEPSVDIGVITKLDLLGELPSQEILGITRMLMESGHQFDIINLDNNLSKYKVVVLPDSITLDDNETGILKKYLDNGGSIIASYKSGLDNTGTHFALDCLGINLKGEAPYSPDFIVPSGAMGKKLPETEHVMYMKGLEIETNPGTEVLCWTKVPYFNRTWEHYNSHMHYPSSGKIGYPGIVKNGKAIYFMHPIFTQYANNAPRWCKQLFLNALDLVLEQPLIKHNGPSTMLVSLNKQNKENRYVLHTLHYIPERRSKMDTIEDVIPLYNIEVSINVPEKISSVEMAPQHEVLNFNYSEGRVKFIIPKINGHEMIALKY